MTKTLPFPFPPVLRKALTGAVVGVAVALALRFFVLGEGILRIGPLSLSGDWVKPLSKYLPPWPLIAGAGGVAGTVVGVVRELRRRRREVEMREVAARMGLDHVAEVPSAAAPLLAGLFEPSSSFAHYSHGLLDGRPVEIVDVTTVREGQPHHGTPQRTRRRRSVCVTEAEGWPAFVLAPRTLWHRFLSLLGIGGLSFNLRGLPSTRDQETVRRFTQRWHLRPGVWENVWTATGADPDAEEQRLREWFTIGRMRAMGEFPEWSIEAKANRLLVWRGRGLRPVSERRALVDAATRLRNVLGGVTTGSTTVVVPMRPGDSWAVRKRRAIGAIVGGVFGAMLGFVGGFLFFVSRFWGLDHGGDAWQPLLFFACPTGGLGLGALGGSLLGSQAGRLLALRATSP